MQEPVGNYLKAITEGKLVKHYPKNQMIFYQGDTPVEVGILIDGYMKLFDIDQHGNEKILHILHPKAITPFTFFIGGSKYIHWYYSALTDCDIVMLPIEELQSKIQGNAQISVELMRWFSREVDELLVRLSSLGKSNAREKILAALKFLASHHAKERPSGWRRINFPVNHQLIADLTGVTRESVATIMKDLANKECIRNPRQTILEVNFAKLIS